MTKYHCFVCLCWKIHGEQELHIFLDFCFIRCFTSKFPHWKRQFAMFKKKKYLCFAQSATSTAFCMNQSTDFQCDTLMNSSRLCHITTTLKPHKKVLHCKRAELVSGWIATYGRHSRPYGVWAETQQWGETRPRWRRRRMTLSSAGRLLNSCKEQFVWQVRLLRALRRASKMLYLWARSLPASKDSQLMIMGPVRGWCFGM